MVLNSAIKAGELVFTFPVTVLSNIGTAVTWLSFHATMIKIKLSILALTICISRKSARGLKKALFK